MARHVPGGIPALRWVVGGAALLAPALHSISDALEWHQGGFSPGQLRINYLAFLPMPWLLLGIYAVHPRRPGLAGLVGALLYGTAFIYFAHTTLLALEAGIDNYQSLWAQLGSTYTLYGALMVLGGLLFGLSAWQASWLPRAAVMLFVAGILGNVLLWLAGAPEILQTAGSALRNLGLMAMGYGILFPTAPGNAPLAR